jgi:signal transduction histidine kinase/DNA-binding response OmpR family regulator
MSLQEQQTHQLHEILQLNTRLTGCDNEAVLLDEAVGGICRILDLVDVTIVEWEEARWWIRTTTAPTLQPGIELQAELAESVAKLTRSVAQLTEPGSEAEQFVQPLTADPEISGRIISPLLVGDSLLGAVISHTGPQHDLQAIALPMQAFSTNLAVLWDKLSFLLETQKRARHLEELHSRQIDTIHQGESPPLVARYENRVLEFERKPQAQTAEPSDHLPALERTIPLVVGDRPIGDLSLPADIELDEEEADFVEALLREMGNALTNAQLLQTTRSYSAQLQVAADVSRAASTILELDVLIRQVVELVRDSFDLYYVGLFLIDDYDNAVLLAGTGEAGRLQIEQGHKLRIGGQSMIGQAISRDEAMVEQDVTQSADWRPNPYLPDTRSELALPLRTRGRTTGALTVQSTRIGTFTRENITVLQTVADQMAIAIENASLFAQIQENLEEIREVNNRLRELDQLKTQFLANMSHELRTPLNSIIGFSRVILKGIDGSITAEQEEDLTSIHNSGQHLLFLINDILDVARIEAGKMTLAFEKVDVEEMANSVNATVRGLVKDKEIELNWQIEKGLPPVEADPIRLRQILLNLLSNSAKFTEMGRISLYIFREGEHHVHMVIQDTGIGIAEESYDVLFEAFEQVDSSVTRSFGGTGLGLPITKRLVELHHGQVWLESEVGRGSVFHVLLPIFQSSAGMDFPQPGRFMELDFDSQPNGRPSFQPQPAILVVDDEPGVVGLYERYLRGRPYQILQANSGAEALQTIQEYDGFIHLILLDINMPGLTGWDVLKEMNDNPDIKDIPVIVCSIENEPDKAAALGARQSLLKPIVEDDLLHALREVGIDE